MLHYVRHVHIYQQVKYTVYIYVLLIYTRYTRRITGSIARIKSKLLMYQYMMLPYMLRLILRLQYTWNICKSIDIHNIEISIKKKKRKKKQKPAREKYIRGDKSVTLRVCAWAHWLRPAGFLFITLTFSISTLCPVVLFFLFPLVALWDRFHFVKPSRDRAFCRYVVGVRLL